MKMSVCVVALCAAAGLETAVWAEGTAGVRPLACALEDAKVTVKGKGGYWEGSTQYTIDFEGWSAQLVEPKEPRGDGAWVWCMKWPGAFSAFSGQEDAVRHGYRYVYLDDKLWMNDEGVAKAKRFHDFLVTKLGFAPKAFLIGMSWGGFYSTRYAAAHPEDVAKIYYDAPLMGFHAFGIRGWKESAAAWGLTPEQKTDPDWRHDPRMPINLGEKIARAGIPILLLYGGVDDVVKPAENCEIFLKGFRAAGGKAKVIRREDFWHWPHGFVDPSQKGWIVDFFEGRDFAYDSTFDAIARRAHNVGFRNKQAQDALKDKAAITNYAALAETKDGVTTWDAALRQAMAEHAVVTFPKGDYLFAETIRLASNHRLEADKEATVGHAPSFNGILLRNVPGAKNIQISGGTWYDFDRGGRQTAPDGDNSQMFRFLNCEQVTFRDLSVSNAPTFSFQAGGITNLLVENVRILKGGADGIHLNGWIKNALVRNVRGDVGDDIVALNAWDWPKSTECQGPSEDVLIDNVQGSYGAVRLLPGRIGSLDCSVRRVIVENCRGLGGVKMAFQGVQKPDQTMGHLSDIYFENVTVDLRRSYTEKPELAKKPGGQGHFAAFEFGSDAERVTFRNVTVDFHADRYPSGHFLLVGPWWWEKQITPVAKDIRVENFKATGVVPSELCHETVFDSAVLGKEFTGRGRFENLMFVNENEGRGRSPEGRGRSPSASSAVAQELGKYADSTELPGIVSGIMSADGKVTIDCFGYADIGTRRPMRPDTLFWIASNTKGIAAALFLTVWDEGKVALDDPVEKYLPEFAGIHVADTNAPGGVRAPKSRPTVRQLLSHTSGLRFFPQMPIDQWPMRLLADKAAHTPLQSDPGTQYAYSNWGIDCAMAIVESVTGKPWDVLLKERILDPLGMTDTTFFPTEEQMSRLAQIYILKDGEAPKLFKSVDQFQWPYSLHTRYAEAGGGLFSTATDMVSFFGMLARGGVTTDGKRILSEKAMAEWCRKQTPEAVKTNYSFGMGVDPIDHFIAHGGAYGTFGAANWAKRDVHVFMVQMLGSSKLYDEYKNAWFRSVKTMLSDKVEGNRPPAAR